MGRCRYSPLPLPPAILSPPRGLGVVICANIFPDLRSERSSGFSISPGETKQEDPPPGRKRCCEFLARFEVFAGKRLLGG